MTRHVALKPHARYAKAVWTPSSGACRYWAGIWSDWHMVGLACGHGCDIRWFNRDIDFRIGLEDCRIYLPSTKTKNTTT